MIERARMVSGLAAAVFAGALVGAGAAGCKDRKPADGAAQVGRDAGTAVAVVVDAGGGAAVDPDQPGGPDEAALRAGKRTGLGSPEETPEVATEELIEALVAGIVPWSHLVDPVKGVVELKLPPDGGAVARRCGAGLTAALDALTAAMKGAAAGGLGYTLDCDNAGLFTVDGAGAKPSAVCSLESPASETIIVDLVFVPDATRGLRLVGMSTVPSEADVGAVLPDFETAMARDDQRCP